MASRTRCESVGQHLTPRVQPPTSDSENQVIMGHKKSFPTNPRESLPWSKIFRLPAGLPREDASYITVSTWHCSQIILGLQVTTERANNHFLNNFVQDGSVKRSEIFTCICIQIEQANKARIVAQLKILETCLSSQMTTQANASLPRNSLFTSPRLDENRLIDFPTFFPACTLLPFLEKQNKARFSMNTEPHLPQNHMTISPSVSAGLIRVSFSTLERKDSNPHHQVDSRSAATLHF